MTGPCLCGDPACGICFPGLQESCDVCHFKLYACECTECPKCDVTGGDLTPYETKHKCRWCGHEWRDME